MLTAIIVLLWLYSPWDVDTVSRSDASKRAIRAANALLTATIAILAILYVNQGA